MNSSKNPRHESHQSASLTRREFVGACGALAAASALPIRATAQQPPANATQQSGGFRFLFMPDFHLRREFDSAAGMAKALDAAMALDPKPAFIVTGGDLCQNLRDQTLDQCEEMADLFVKLWAEHVNVPTYHALGNHDPAGWGKGLESFPGGTEHPLFGFRLMQRRLNMPALSHSFDHGGWRFVIVHNAKPADPAGGGSVIGEFQEEAMAFLRDDLAKPANKGKPTMLFGHYPPVTAIEFFNGEAKHNDELKRWELGYARATCNPMALIEAIGDANVKAFFSGHIHRLDQIDVKGQRLICAGSVSGDQWRGPDVDTEEGFAIIDCRADGSFDYRYHEYGWNATSQR
jgi:3',5'-cyclic AMP phosphodiesterase CpdA